MTEVQICLTCKISKSIEDFEKRSDTGKYRSQCKSCRNNYVKQYKHERASGVRGKSTIVIDNNTKECKKCNMRKPLSDFPSRDTEHGYRHECKMCKKDIMSIYNKEVYNKVRRERKKTDLQYKLTCNNRLYVYKCLKQFKDRESSKRYIGTSVENLAKWITFMFDVSMTWDNYPASWTIDHVIPLSWFNLESQSDRKIAFHWTNIQPLQDNFVKSNKLRLHEFWNSIVSACRFIQYANLGNEEYQIVFERIRWLREKLRYGNNLLDNNNANIIAMLVMGNPQPSSKSVADKDIEALVQRLNGIGSEGTSHS